MMKKIFALVFILVLGKMSYSQNYPLTQQLGSDSTIVISKGALQSRLAPIVISDTTAANNQRIKNYPGAQLYTANGDFYVRNATATKWVLVSSGSSGPINIYNSDGTLTGNRVLTGAGNSLTFNGISGLGINKVADSVFTVEGGIHATGGLRLDNLVSSPGTKTLRIDGQGVVSVADTTVSGGTVTSVGLTMPTAFNVSGSPITSAGTLSVTAAGVASQYIRGDGQLATLPTTGGGGSSVSYYLNGSVNQGTFGGNTYYQMNKTPVIGTGTDFTISSNGYIASFITDAGDPDLLNIPAGNWDFEIYFQSSSNSGTPSFYVELYKYNGTTFTLIASSSTNPKFITSGTNVDAYYTPLPVPATTLAITDRLAIRVYVNNSGNTITLHTEDNNLCQVITTFSTGINALNGLTDQVQYFAVGTSGTDFNISSLTDTHTFNLPTASATNRGALSTTDWTTFNSKISPSDTASMLAPYLRKADTTAMLANYVNNVGYGLSKAGQVVIADSATLANYFLRRKDSLTSTNLLGYVTRTILADTAAAIRSADAGGTVTSIATNNGTGITGGTITTTGTLAIDTLLISTRAWRQKGVDSVAALVNSNVSGTTNRVSKFTGANTIGNSSIADSSVVGVAMTISSFANVGIGTATPSSRLEVSGNATIKTNFASLNLDNTTSTTPVWMKINNGGGNYLMGVANNSGTTIMSSTTSPYAFVINAQSSRDVVIGTNDLERMRVDSTGKVGIGTTTIDSMLTVAQGAYFQRGVRMSGLPTAVGTKALRIDANGTLSVADTTTGGGGGIGGSGTTNYLPKFTASTTLGDSRFFDNGTVTFLGNGDVNGTPSTGIFSGTGGTGSNIAGAELRIRGGASTGNAAGGAITFFTSAAGTSGTTVNAATERMRIASNGFVGIGIANPTTNLEIFNALGASVIVGATTGKSFLYGDDNGGTVGTLAAIPLRFHTSNAEAMRLTSGGATANLGIGTTTIGSKLQVNGNAAIGYSASTAAPTNGLQVAGSITGASNGNSFGTNSAGGFPVTINAGSGANALRIIGRNNAPDDIGSIEFFRFDGTTRQAFIQAATSFIAFATSSEAMRINSSNFLGIGTTTIGSRLQVNGGAAIGYSASTAAPTNGLVVAGDVNVSATGSNTTTPRIMGITNLGASTAARVQFGDLFNCFQTSNGGLMQLVSYHGMQIYGARVNNGATFTAGAATDPSLNVIGTEVGRPTLVVTGGASQTANLQQWRNSSNTVLSVVTSDGSLGLNTTTVGSRLQVNGNAAIGYSASTAAPSNGLAVSGDVSIGTNTANSKLHVAGSLRLPITTKTATYTLDASDYTVVFDLNGNATANLPDATTIPGRIYVIKINRTSVTDTLTIDPNGTQTIDGNATIAIQCQYAVTIQSDGTNWRIIGDYAQGLNCL